MVRIVNTCKNKNGGTRYSNSNDSTCKDFRASQSRAAEGYPQQAVLDFARV